MTTHTLNSDVIASPLGYPFYWAGSLNTQPGYWKDPYGHVHLRGTIVASPSAAAGAIVFTLPVGFRPTGVETFGVIFWGFGQTINQLQINGLNGQVVLIQSLAANLYATLSGVTFLAEA